MRKDERDCTPCEKTCQYVWNEASEGEEKSQKWNKQKINEGGTRIGGETKTLEESKALKFSLYLFAYDVLFLAI